MGHRVAVMSSGNLAQCDTPFALYEHPANMFVAGFIGSPAMNLFVATLSPELDSVTLGSQRLALPAERLERSPGLRAYAGQDVAIGLRPEHLTLVPDTHPGPVLSVDVDLTEQLGSEQMLYFRIDAERAQPQDVRGDEEQELLPGGVGVARVAADARVSPGAKIAFSVNLARAHFFDRESEAVIE